MRMLYVIYVIVVLAVATSLNYGGENDGGHYRSWNTGGSSYGGGYSGGHK